MQSAGDDSFILTLAPLVETINKQRFRLALHFIVYVFFFYLAQSLFTSTSLLFFLKSWTNPVVYNECK